MAEAPKFRYSKWAKANLPPEHSSQQGWDDFFRKEKEYWKKGRYGLTGYHYFYLTQLKIKNRTTGEEIRPVWRDVDEIIFNGYDQALKTGSDLIFVKRREVGLTSVFGAAIPFCNIFIHTGTTQLLTSADQPRIKDLFKEKVTIAYDTLDSAIRPSRAQFQMTGSMFFADKDERTGIISGLKSSIICRETVKNPKALEGYGAKSVFIDEFFLHPRAPDVLASVQASVNRGFVKACPIVMGGSCGDTSDEGLKKGKELWEDAETLKIITCFIPGWMGIMEAPELDEEGKETGKVVNFCPNGWSDEAGATKWIMQTRKRLAKAKNKTAYITFCKNYPLTIEEVFSFGGGGILPQEILEKVEDRKIYLLSNPAPDNTYRLEEMEGKIVAVPDKNGKHHILEMPQTEQLYVSGSDPIGWDTDSIKKGSEYCITIKKHLASTYVHYFTVRSLDEKFVITECIKAQRFFNNAKTLLEMNKGGVALKTYRDFGRLDLLAKRPNALGIKFSGKDAYGWWKGGGMNPATQRGVEMVVNYLNHHIEQIYFRRILDEVARFPHGNTDLLDAIMSCEMQDQNIIELKKVAPVIRPPRMIYTVGRDSQGRTKGVWKQVG